MLDLNSNEVLDLSVVIPAFRARNFIGRSIRSALASENVDLEVIVVDDCSDDDTANAVEREFSADNRVKVLRRLSNGGPSASRNDGFSVASGRWIAVLDADDEVLPDRFRRLIDAGQSHACDLVADNITLWNAELNQQTGNLLIRDGVCHIDLAEFLKASFLTGNDYGLLKPIFLKSFLREHSIRYHEELRHGEDFEFVGDALYEGAKYFVIRNYSGYRYTTRESGLSRTSINDQAMIDWTKRWFGRPKIQQSKDLQKILHGRIAILKTLQLHRMSGNNSSKERFRIAKLALKSSAGRRWLLADLARRVPYRSFNY